MLKVRLALAVGTVVSLALDAMCWALTPLLNAGHTIDWSETPTADEMLAFFNDDCPPESP